MPKRKQLPLYNEEEYMRLLEPVRLYVKKGRPPFNLSLENHCLIKINKEIILLFD